MRTVSEDWDLHGGGFSPFLTSSYAACATVEEEERL